jgi:sugar (pentulose or hexulose) kinase
MMHGYLAFDAAGELLVPFRTWRNTSTGPAAAQLSERFGLNIPLRWSIAHLYQAILDGEPHVARISSINTLAGYVHRTLTGRTVLGIGDASGMFPIDPVTGDYDADKLGSFDALVAELAESAESAEVAESAGRAKSADSTPALKIAELLPQVLAAGQPAGELTAEGAALLDPSGALEAGIPLCPPEGDAGTGMVATNSVAPRTGNVSAGTSIFAMVVLEGSLEHAHHEVDLVATPAGDPVAMVHCNNGASELAAWAGLFSRFADAAGATLDGDAVYELLLREALDGEADAGGVLAYNQLAGEPIAGLPEGRPMIVRTPDSRLTLANLMRAQLYGVFGTLSLGMRVLAEEGVGIDRMFAHGGIFRTAGVAQRVLAGALDTPVAVGDTASEGGAWGVAVLASYLSAADELDLGTYLAQRVFAGADVHTVAPDAADVAGYASFLESYQAGLAVEAAAVEALSDRTSPAAAATAAATTARTAAATAAPSAAHSPSGSPAA